MTRPVFVALILVALASPLASAQSPAAPRGVVSVNGGWQSSNRTFADSITYDQYAESGKADIDYAVRSGPFFDGGLGIRLWKALGAGVSFSSFKDTSTADVSATVPHPFFFGRSRQIDGTVNTKREETAINTNVMAFVPAGSRVLLVLAAGPSFMTVRQTLVTSVRWSESYPYDTAAFSTADTKTPSENVTGFNAGADIVVKLGRSFGVGALLRYTHAEVNLSPAKGRTIKVDAGGFQAGAGIRVVF